MICAGTKKAPRRSSKRRGSLNISGVIRTPSSPARRAATGWAGQNRRPSTHYSSGRSARDRRHHGHRPATPRTHRGLPPADAGHRPSFPPGGHRLAPGHRSAAAVGRTWRGVPFSSKTMQKLRQMSPPQSASAATAGFIINPAAKPHHACGVTVGTWPALNHAMVKTLGALAGVLPAFAGLGQGGYLRIAQRRGIVKHG